MSVAESTVAPELPDIFARWFAARGWAPRAHQLALLDVARRSRSALLIAPTGAGKTLAGFLPSLVELSERSPVAGKTSPRTPPAPSPPSPAKTGVNALMAGEGWGGGSKLARTGGTPTPNPSPQGGGERAQFAASSHRRLISTGRGVRREGGLHTLYISPLK